MACNTPESTSQVDSVIPFPQYDMYYISGHPALRFASDSSTPFCRLATSSRFLFLKSSAGRTQLKLCKLEKVVADKIDVDVDVDVDVETLAIRNASRRSLLDSSTLALRNASRRSLLDSSTLALRNARKTLGKERDCSQSIHFACVLITHPEKRLYTT